MEQTAHDRPPPARRRRLGRALVVLLALALAVTVVAGGYVGYAAVQHDQPVELPAPSGPYPVGRTAFEWTDRHRTDPLAPQPNARRTLSVWLWYPAGRHGNGPRTRYAPGAWSELHFNLTVLHGHAVRSTPAGTPPGSPPPGAGSSRSGPPTRVSPPPASLPSTTRVASQGTSTPAPPPTSGTPSVGRRRSRPAPPTRVARERSTWTGPRSGPSCTVACAGHS